LGQIGLEKALQLLGWIVPWFVGGGNRKLLLSDPPLFDLLGQDGRFSEEFRAGRGADIFQHHSVDADAVLFGKPLDHSFQGRIESESHKQDSLRLVDRDAFEIGIRKGFVEEVFKALLGVCGTDLADSLNRPRLDIRGVVDCLRQRLTG
jgi:hypothetical protein